MTYSTGIAGQLGIGQESTHNTAVTVDHFYGIDPGESLAEEPSVFQGDRIKAGIGAPFRHGSGRRKAGQFGSGDFTLGLPLKGAGLLLKNMFGTVAGPTQQGGTAAYQTVASPGPLYGTSMTIQKGVPDESGTVKPWTFTGCKVANWSAGCELGDELKLNIGISASEVLTNVALATASYPTPEEAFFFTEGQVLLGGTASTASGVVSVSGGTSVAELTGFEVAVDNGLRTGEDNWGFGGVKKQQRETGYREISGSLDGEFATMAARYDLFRADTAVTLRLVFTSTLISGAYSYLFEIIVPEVHLEGETPTLDADVPTFSSDLTGLWDGTNAGIQARLVSTDTTL